MQTRPLVLLGAALLLGTLGLVAARAQDSSPPDYAALVKSLGDEAFDARSKAYEALESAGAAARKALEEGAKSEDPQVRWSARRLLARIDGEDRKPARVLRFSEDPEAFRDLGRRLEDLNRRFEDIRGGFRFEVEPDLQGAWGERRSIIVRDGERVDVRVGPDGKVTVKIGRKDADGKATEESFEAKDMNALEKEHPEVARRLKGWMDRDFLEAALPPKPALGVTVSEVPAVLRTQLSIPEGEGIVVEEVMPGTPAARLGLRHHDVILAINGKPVATAPEVRAAVLAVKEGGELRLKVLRGGKAEEIAGTR
jgi:hypothetical protein